MEDRIKSRGIFMKPVDGQATLDSTDLVKVDKIWYCLLCQEYGHIISEKCVANVICLSCGKKGHTRKDCIVKIEKINIKGETDEKKDFPVNANMVNAIIPEYVEPLIKNEKEVFFKLEDSIKCEPNIEFTLDEKSSLSIDTKIKTEFHVIPLTEMKPQNSSVVTSGPSEKGEECKVCGKFFAKMLSHHYIGHFRNKLIEKYPSSFTGKPPFKCSKCNWCVRSKSAKLQQQRHLMVSHIIGCKDELKILLESEDWKKSRQLDSSSPSPPPRRLSVNSDSEKGDSRCQICKFVCFSEDELFTHLYRKHEELKRKIHKNVLANFSNFYTLEAKKLNCMCPICGEEMKATRAIVGKHWAVDHKQIEPLYQQ